MKIKVTISKRWFIVILIATLILTGIFAAYAYNDFVNGRASIMGHSSDEVDVKVTSRAGTGIITPLQGALDNLVGKTKCGLTSAQLQDPGCPTGTYLYSAKNVCSSVGSCPNSAPKDAICIAFFSTDDNSANIPSCY